MSTTGPEYLYTEAPTLRQLASMAMLPNGIGGECIEADPWSSTPTERNRHGDLLRDDFMTCCCSVCFGASSEKSTLLPMVSPGLTIAFSAVDG